MAIPPQKTRNPLKKVVEINLFPYFLADTSKKVCNFTTEKGLYHKPFDKFSCKNNNYEDRRRHNEPMECSATPIRQR
jgi:hypothetical protein